jgi:KDO2-lipid IV(A) lauroyltransferase
VKLLIKLLFSIFSGKSLFYLRRTGRIVGAAAWHLSASRRRTAIANAAATGAEDPVKTAKESFKHTFMSYMESFFIPQINKNFVQQHVRFIYKGDNKLENSQIIISAHFGCWELAAPVLSAITTHKIGLLAKRIKNKNFDDFIVKQRGYPEKIEYLHHRDSVDRINKMLAEKAHLAALIDHSSTIQDSIFVPFFGFKTTFNKGIPTFSVRRGLSVTPVFAKRTEKGIDIIVYPPIEPDTSLKVKERTYDMALKINQQFEEEIRKNPEQWYLLHKRFKKIEDENGKISGGFYRQRRHH